MGELGGGDTSANVLGERIAGEVQLNRDINQITHPWFARIDQQVIRMRAEGKGQKVSRLPWDRRYNYPWKHEQIIDGVEMGYSFLATSNRDSKGVEALSRLSVVMDPTIEKIGSTVGMLIWFADDAIKEVCLRWKFLNDDGMRFLESKSLATLLTQEPNLGEFVKEFYTTRGGTVGAWDPTPNLTFILTPSPQIRIDIEEYKKNPNLKDRDIDHDLVSVFGDFNGKTREFTRKFGYRGNSYKNFSTMGLSVRHKLWADEALDMLDSTLHLLPENAFPKTAEEVIEEESTEKWAMLEDKK